MKKLQLLLTGSGLIILALLYNFGKTVPPKKDLPTAGNSNSPQSIDFNTILQASKKQLNPAQQAYVNGLEQAVVRGGVKKQQIEVYNQLATFWLDSVKSFLPYAYYIGEQAKLENSEKKLTFAARLYLQEVRRVEQPSIKTWMANQSKELFEKAVIINPMNDSLQIEWGSCYIFGASADNPQDLMQGIQKILQVSRKDSTNMYAQFMLGMGGLQSGQLDKAEERFIKVLKSEPSNIEAILLLAEVYERKGVKADAVKWYEVAQKKIPEGNLKKEIDKRINSLK